VIDMATGQTSSVLPRLRRVALLRDGGGLTDGQLLEAFVSRRDEAAFAALVRRHGAMVLGVCRRVLKNGHDAEDAFQATFLVLARKAASVQQRELVGNWLYGAAYRAALEVRSASATRRAKETTMRDLPEPARADAEDVWRELRPVLDRELNRLPDKYRVPVVLCELEGRPRKEVARQLGLPEGTLSSRLATARKTLARRLARHGRALSAGAVAAALAQGAASARVPAPLVESTVQRAAAGGEISARLAALTEGVLKTMLLTKLKIGVTILLLVAALAGAVGVFAGPATGRSGARSERPTRPAARQGEKPQAVPAWKERHAVEAGAGNQIFSAAVSPDGKVVAFGTTKGANLLDAATGKEIALVTGDLTFAVAISPDGKMLATGHISAIKVWDAANGNHLATLADDTKNVARVAFSPDGKTLATAEVGIVRLWDLSASKELRRFVPDAAKGRVVHGLAFSADGKTLATAEGPARTVKLWDVETGKERKTLEGHTKNVLAVALSPDGKTLASSGGDGQVKLWDVGTGKEKTALQWQTSGGHSLAFSPDGKVLATAGGGSNNVMLWDAKTGKDLVTLEHTAHVWSVAFSRDSRTLVTAGDDAVRIWEPKKSK
jgi:RNA polymerase sigma factor (sigma-70 family)